MPRLRALWVALAAAAALLALAGCGGSDSKTTLDQAQQKRFDGSIDDFLASGTTFITDVERCTRRRVRAQCVQKATTTLNTDAGKTRTTIADLQRGVSGACATQLNLAARRVTEALDVLLPIGTAARSSNVRNTKRLTNRVVAKLRPLADTVRAERRACKA
ncbi:MAG TPA: hypothetical protein VGO81_06905 [Solirubrobacteraceae bacterium]|nr:hypothetical protein [Solirubrobacteraceae bacterium]